jgi:hypothetical protein
MNRANEPCLKQFLNLSLNGCFFPRINWTKFLLNRISIRIRDANAPPRARPLPQDLLFLERPEELKCSSNPLIGSFSTPTECSYDLPLSYREIGPRVIASPALTRSGLTNPRTPMNIHPRVSLLYREFPRREIGTYEVVNHSPHGSPIPDLRWHSLHPLAPSG